MSRIFRFQIGDPNWRSTTFGAFNRLKLVAISLLAIVITAFIITFILYFPSSTPSSSSYQPYHGLQITLNPNSTPDDPETLFRREFIKNMTIESWNAYHQYAFKYARNGLKPNWDSMFSKARNPPPESSSDHNWWRGETIVRAASTFWLMNLTEQYNQTLKWIQNESFISTPLHLNTMSTKRDQFETIYLTSLLSCFALTQNPIFLNRAQELAQLLNPFYQNPKSLKDLDPSGLYLTYRYLFNLTGNYQNRLQVFQDQLSVQPKINSDSKLKWWHPNLPPFYIYQPQSFIQTTGSNLNSLKIFEESIQIAENNSIFGQSTQSNLTFIRYYGNSTQTDSMFAEDCRLAGSFGLVARILESIDPIGTNAEKIVKYWSLAEQLAETCHQAALKTQSGLPPERFFFNQIEDGENTQNRILGLGKKFALSPDLPETYFLLYRLTHSPKYRHYAWQFAQSIYAHCRTSSGAYSSLSDINDITSEHHLIDYQPGHFLGSTLKYLYLIFSNDDLLPVDRWIWTEQGQPLPVL